MRWPVKIYRVVGESMEPTYSHGELLLGSGWIPRKPGRAVVVHPGDHASDARSASSHRNHIKRIISIDQRGIWVEGDNTAASTDSRHMGYLHPGDIKAVIVKRIA